MPATRKFLVAAAALAMTALYAPAASAQSLSPSTGGCAHAFVDTGFSGPDTYFCGSGSGECTYVGDNWNDRIQSARTENSSVLVELWDNYNCTGGSITVDASGYSEIGKWVSAYRVELLH